MAPTCQKVEQLYRAIQHFSGDDTPNVAWLEPAQWDGKPVACKPNCFADFVTSVAEAQSYWELRVLAAVDNALALFKEEKRPDTDSCTYAQLLALRHEYLDDVMYSTVLKDAPQLPSVPQVFLCTLPFLQTLQGEGRWSQLLKESKKELLKESQMELMLLVDDFHQASMEGLLAALASFDCVVLAGDVEKASPKVAEWCHLRPAWSEPPEPSSPESWGQSKEPLGTRYGRRAPRKHLSSDWVADAGLPSYQFNKSFTLGCPVTACLKAMSPDTWSDLVHDECAAKHTDTQVIPLLCGYLDDAQYCASTLEVTSSKTVFVHAAVTIAMELVHGQLTQNVLCIAFHRRLLGEFRRYLHRALPDIMKRMGDHMQLALPCVDVGQMEQTGQLSFRTTDEAGGGTQAIAVLLALRWQKQDRNWQGENLLHPGYRYTGLTCATTRLYVFAEDLREEGHVQPSIFGREVQPELVDEQNQVSGEKQEELQRQKEWSCLLRHLQSLELRMWYLTDCALEIPSALLKLWNQKVPEVAELWKEELRFRSTRYAEEYQPQMVIQASHMTREEGFSKLAGLLEQAPPGLADVPPPFPLDFKEAYSEATSPRDSDITRAWRPAAIDALTVHVEGPDKVLITIPLNLALDLAAHHNLAGKNLAYYKDCNHLAGALSRITIKRYNTATAPPLMTAAIWQHKNREYLQDGMEFWVPQGTADKPAFVGVVGDNVEDHVEDKEGKLRLYMYNPATIHRQHGDLGCLVAWCGSFMTATMLLRVCSEFLGLSYRQERVKFITGFYVTESVKTDWHEWCGKRQVPKGPARARLEDMFSRTKRPAYQGMVDSAASAVNRDGMAEFLNLVDGESG